MYYRYERVNELLGTGYRSDQEIDWSFIVRKYRFKLSEEFIREFKYDLDWNWISRFQRLSESFIEEHKDLVDWMCISFSQALSEPFIEKYKDKLSWMWISGNQKLSESFIENHKGLIDWNRLSSNQDLSEEFMRRNKNRINWSYVSSEQVLSESFIREFKDCLDWPFISEYQLLSSGFIKEFKERLNWDLISRYQPFIDLEDPDIRKRVPLTRLKKNTSYKIYQETKDRGWFIGYLDKTSSGLLNFYNGNEQFSLKVKVYWKDLIKLNRTKEYEFIREVKYI